MNEESPSILMSEEINLSFSHGKKLEVEMVEDNDEFSTRRFELMDSGQLYNGVRFTSEALQHQYTEFLKHNFLVTHGMDHTGDVLDQLGPVIDMDIENDNGITRVFITSKFLKKTDNQQQAQILFEQGLLNYISGGWRARIVFDDETEEFVVFKPLLREVSSTPIPAKTDAKLQTVLQSLISQNEAPTIMEESIMTENETQIDEPSPEGVEAVEQEPKISTLSEEQMEVVKANKQAIEEIRASHAATIRASLLERAKEFGLSEDDFKDVSNDKIEHALEVANKVRMSTLRETNPDIPLGGNGDSQAMTEKEVIDTYYDWDL